MGNFIGITVSSTSYVSRNGLAEDKLGYVGINIDVWKWDSEKLDRVPLGHFKVYKTSYERRKQTISTLIEPFDSLRIKRLITANKGEDCRDELDYDWEQSIYEQTNRTPGYLDIWLIHSGESNFAKYATEEEIREAVAIFIADYVSCEDVIIAYGLDVCKLDNILEPLGFGKCDCGIFFRDMHYPLVYKLKVEKKEK